MQSNDLAQQILTGRPYPIKALWAHGMNYRMFPGDGAFTEAFRELDFFADVDLFLTDTAKWADIVLPACSNLERGEFKVWPGYAQYTEPVIAPLGQSRPDTDILFSLADALELDDGLLRSGYDACLRDILRDTGIDVEALKSDRQRPHPVNCPPYKPGVKTPSGKFELWSKTIEALGIPGLDALPTYRPPFAPDARFPMTLVSGARLPNALHSRCHDVPWLRNLRPEPAADMNPADLEGLGIRPGDKIEIGTSCGSLAVQTTSDPGVPVGCVFFYHGYREADVNAIVPPTQRDPYSGFPAYRSVPCAVAKKEDG